MGFRLQQKLMTLNDLERKFRLNVSWRSLLTRRIILDAEQMLFTSQLPQPQVQPVHLLAALHDPFFICPIHEQFISIG